DGPLDCERAGARQAPLHRRAAGGARAAAVRGGLRRCGRRADDPVPRLGRRRAARRRQCRLHRPAARLSRSAGTRGRDGSDRVAGDDGWRRIGRAYGPFDVAFLPINGFAQTDLVPSTTLPYAMTPEVALQAARLLGAQTVVPIHFGRAPSQTYVETDAPERRFVDEARRLGQAVRVLRAGDELKLAAIA